MTTKNVGELTPDVHGRAIVGVCPRWFTVAFLGKDGLYYPVTMRGQGFRPLYDELDTARAHMLGAKRQGINAVVLSFELAHVAVEDVA